MSLIGSESIYKRAMWLAYWWERRKEAKKKLPESGEGTRLARILEMARNFAATRTEAKNYAPSLRRQRPLANAVFCANGSR